MSKKIKVLLTEAEQIFLMNMFEVKDVQKATESYCTLIQQEGGNASEINKYVKKAMIAYAKKKK